MNQKKKEKKIFFFKFCHKTAGTEIWIAIVKALKKVQWLLIFVLCSGFASSDSEKQFGTNLPSDSLGCAGSLGFALFGFRWLWFGGGEGGVVLFILFSLWNQPFHSEPVLVTGD